MSKVKVDDDGIPYWDMLPGTRMDIVAEWSAWAAEVSDTISSTRWSASPSGLTITSSKVNGADVVIWVQPSVGNANTNYLLTSKVFTPAPNSRKDKQKFRIKVGN